MFSSLCHTVVNVRKHIMRIAGKTIFADLNIVSQMQILCEGKVSTANENNKKTLNQTISTRVSCNIIPVKKSMQVICSIQQLYLLYTRMMTHYLSHMIQTYWCCSAIIIHKNTLIYILMLDVATFLTYL